MKVVLGSANFRPHVGGIERFAELLAGGLGARGHEVTVLCLRSDGAPLEEVAEGYRIVRVRSSYVLERRLAVPYPLPGPELLAKARQIVGEADVVHVQDAVYATSVALLRAARKRSVPTVLTQHVGFVPQRHAFLDAIQRGVNGRLGRMVRETTVIATLNPSVAAWAADTWKITTPRVLPVGVPNPEPTLDRSAARRSFGLEDDRFTVLFVGRDVPKKGLDVFLAAADPAYDLVAVTDREQPASGVRLLPFMSPGRLVDLLACVDAFALPSEGEGFPLTLQEAFSAGIPVVTTMQPGYEHYLAEDDVLVVERDPSSLRRALVRLAGEPALQQRLAQRARAVAERSFGIERFVSAYEALYVEAVERGRRPITKI